MAVLRNLNLCRLVKDGSSIGKLFGVMIASVFSFSATVHCASVTVAWNAVTDPGTAGYIVSYGTNSANFRTNINTGTNTSAVISGLVPGQTNYFTVAAYNSASIQGTNSSPIAFIVPGSLGVSASPSLTLSFPVGPGHYYVVQASTNLTAWSNIYQTATESSNVWVTYQDPQSGTLPRRFYRLVLH